MHVVSIFTTVLYVMDEKILGTYNFVDTKMHLIESDNQLAIKLSSVSELVPPWDIATIVWDIRQFREELGPWGVTFASARRKANQLGSCCWQQMR